MTFLGGGDIKKQKKPRISQVEKTTLSEKRTIDYNIQKLAESLIARDRKKALSIIRSRLNKPFESNTQHFVWKGWERALARQENNALIFQMLNGIEFPAIKKIFHDMKRKKTEILLRDHTQTALAKEYLPTWISLLEIYCNIYQDKQ